MFCGTMVSNDLNSVFVKLSLTLIIPHNKKTKITIITTIVKINIVCCSIIFNNNKEIIKEINQDQKMGDWGDWYCDKCGYKNFRRNVNCRSCRNSNGSSSTIKVRGDDWFCPKCRAHQFARNKVCRDCATPKPDDIDQLKCIICCTEQRNSSLIHGNDAHMVTCYSCATKLDKCPVCRQTVTKVVKIYE